MTTKRTKPRPPKSAAPLPTTADELHSWLRQSCDIHIPRQPLLAASDAPFDYLVHTFFEGRASARAHPPASHPSPDCVVWANRGGGKTFLGAVATMLDLVHKPGIQVRILGGSLDQSQRMHAHLRRIFESPALARFLDGPITTRRVRLLNGSAAEVLAQSQTSVRGTRVQKVRCDEVDLFQRHVWDAAQLTTRSAPIPGPWGPTVRGSIEALSTMHRPYGLMWDLAGGAHPRSDAPQQQQPGADAPRRLFRWGVVDVLGECGPEHRCRADGAAPHDPPAAGDCPLWRECAGRAKASRTVAGHISIDDVIGMKRRVDVATWDSEMLCLRPRRSDAVLPEFDERVHVFGEEGAFSVPSPLSPIPSLPCPLSPITYIAGMDFGFRSPTVVLLARLDPDGVLRILDEHIHAGRTLDWHIQAITRTNAWPPIHWIGIDPAGRARNDQTGISAAAALRRAGLSVRFRRSGIQEGLSLVRARLAPADSQAGAGERLLIHRRCARLIESLHRYHYDPDRPESLEPVKDGFDHAVDALRYLIVNLDANHRTAAGRYA